jgi:hypothetical protein
MKSEIGVEMSLDAADTRGRSLDTRVKSFQALQRALATEL